MSLKSVVWVLIIGLCVVSAAVGLVIHWRSNEITYLIKPENFEQCALIYGIIEGTPRRCQMPDGTSLTEQVPLEFHSGEGTSTSNVLFHASTSAVRATSSDVATSTNR